MKAGKKTYQAPRLTVYGDVRQLTRALSGNAPNKDGGANNTKSF